MQEPDIPQPEHFDELCRQVGLVVMQAQLLEGSLARYIVLHRRFNDGLVYDQVHEALAAADRKTIGNLLKQIDDKCPLPENLTERLIKFCDDRNWLVHRINREHPSAIYQRDKAEPVFDKINDLARSILEIMQDLDVVGDKMLSEQGIDPIAVKKKARQYSLRKAGQLSIDEGSESPKK